MLLSSPFFQSSISLKVHFICIVYGSSGSLSNIVYLWNFDWHIWLKCNFLMVCLDSLKSCVGMVRWRPPNWWRSSPPPLYVTACASPDLKLGTFFCCPLFLANRASLIFLRPFFRIRVHFWYLEVERQVAPVTFAIFELLLCQITADTWHRVHFIIL